MPNSIKVWPSYTVKRLAFQRGLLRTPKLGACCWPWAGQQHEPGVRQGLYMLDTLSCSALLSVAYWNTPFLFCLRKGFIGLALCPILTSPSHLLFVKTQPWLKPATSFILCDGCCFLSMDFFPRLQFPQPSMEEASTQSRPENESSFVALLYFSFCLISRRGILCCLI